MNVNWSDASTWIDILDHFLIGIFVLGAAVVPSLLTLRNHRSIKSETTVIKEQLVNGHKSPLRADMDRALEAIEALSQNVMALRHDLLAERDSRKAQVEDLRTEVDAMRRRTS